MKSNSIFWPMSVLVVCIGVLIGFAVYDYLEQVRTAEEDDRRTYIMSRSLDDLDRMRGQINGTWTKLDELIYWQKWGPK